MERRETVKRNGAGWMVKVRSEDSLDMVRLPGKEALLMPEECSKTSSSAGIGRGITSWGTAHREWLASVMRTWSQLSVSRLPPVISKLKQWAYELCALGDVQVSDCTSFKR